MFQRFTRRHPQSYSGLAQLPEGDIYLVREDEVKARTKELYHDFLTAVFSRASPEDVERMLEKKYQDIEQQYGRNSLKMAVLAAAAEEITHKIEARLLTVSRLYIAVGEVLLKVATVVAPLYPASIRPDVQEMRRAIDRVRQCINPPNL